MFKVPKVTLRGFQVRTFWSDWELRRRKLVFTGGASWCCSARWLPQPKRRRSLATSALRCRANMARSAPASAAEENQAAEPMAETPITPAGLFWFGLKPPDRDLHSQVPEQTRRDLSGLKTSQNRRPGEDEEELASI